MAVWKEFAAQAPEIASAGQELIFQFGSGSGYFATVGPDGRPLIAPVAAALIDDALLALLPAAGDVASQLASDARYAFHTEGPLETDDEFYISGSARRASATQEAAALAVPLSDARLVPSPATAFELDLERALLATYRPRAEGNTWPPRYARWSAEAATTRQRTPARTQSPSSLAWRDFVAEAPDLSAAVRSQLYYVGIGLGLLATVRPDGGPRLHPFCPIFSGDGFYGLILEASPKCADLLRNPSVAIHGCQFPESPRAVLVRGVAVHQTEPALVAQVEDSFREVGGKSEDHLLFEFRIECVTVVENPAQSSPAVTWTPNALSEAR